MTLLERWQLWRETKRLDKLDEHELTCSNCVPHDINPNPAPIILEDETIKILNDSRCS